MAKVITLEDGKKKIITIDTQDGSVGGASANYVFQPLEEVGGCDASGN